VIRKNGRHGNIRELGSNSFIKGWLGLFTGIFYGQVGELIDIANNVDYMYWNEMNR